MLSILKQKERIQAAHIELEKQITLEKAQYPLLTIEQVNFFMNRFKNGDVNIIK